MTAQGGRSGRRLSNEESELWTIVTRSVRPMRKPAASAAPKDLASADIPKPPRARARKEAPPAIAMPAKPKAAPAPSVLDRKLKQKLARGSQSIEGRLDLHGHTQAEAHDALLRFLRSAQGRGKRLVLVITGKGARGQGEGVLRRSVPLWLALPEFRALVVSFDAAAPAHGGDGALYIRLRKRTAE